MNYDLLRLQGILLESALISAASELKEYKEDWRKTPIMRQGGRFASSVKTAVGDAAGTTEQGIKNTIEAINKQIDQFSQSLAKLGGEAQQKLRNIFQSEPMNKAKDKMGGVLEVDSEARQTPCIK